MLNVEIDEYTRKKKGLGDFRNELEKYIRETSPDKPIVIFIDELDRCRPNYSREVLEQVKHFFSVPRIVFVLSMDKEQLGNAVKGFYNLYEYYGFDEFFGSDGRKDTLSLPTIKSLLTILSRPL